MLFRFRSTWYVARMRSRGAGRAPANSLACHPSCCDHRPWLANPCDAASSAAAAAGMRQGGGGAGRTCHTSLVMYRRSPAGLNPASSFIVHLLSSNEPFGTRTIARTLLVLPLRRYCMRSGGVVYSNCQNLHSVAFTATTLYYRGIGLYV